MMTKAQPAESSSNNQAGKKIWMWIFMAMFIIPEILFSTILSSIINYSGKDFLTLSSLFFNSRFFINNYFYFFVVIITELVGIFGLLIISIRNKKIIFITLLAIILLWLLFVFFLGYVSSNIRLVM